MSLVKKLSEIQLKLKAPKNQYNSFGKYNYRNCEDILEAVKPLLGDLIINVSDKIEMFGDRIYVTATATIQDDKGKIESSASAREPLLQKGMNDPQITGSVSSYARKYALNGLLLIDDTKDSDATNTHGKSETKKETTATKTKTSAPSAWT